MHTKLLPKLLAAVLAVVPLAGIVHAATPASAASPPLDAAARQLRAEAARVGAQRFTGPDYKPGVVRHIVMFRYKPDTPVALRRKIRDAFVGMQATAVRDGRHYIVSIETGRQNSGENADQNLEQAFLLTFKSEGDRNYFIGQPLVTDAKYYEHVHQAFKEFALPHLDKNGAVVFDYTREQVAPNP